MTEPLSDCSWHTVAYPEHVAYNLWYKDILPLSCIYKMPDTSEWLPGKWVCESYVAFNDSNDLEPMIDCAEEDAEHIINDDRQWLEEHEKEVD